MSEDDRFSEVLGNTRGKSKGVQPTPAPINRFAPWSPELLGQAREYLEVLNANTLPGVRIPSSAIAGADEELSALAAATYGLLAEESIATDVRPHGARGATTRLFALGHLDEAGFVGLLVEAQTGEWLLLVPDELARA